MVANELGLEQIASPSATAPLVYLRVVQAMFSVRPELDQIGRTLNPVHHERRGTSLPLNFLSSFATSSRSLARERRRAL